MSEPQTYIYGPSTAGAAIFCYRGRARTADIEHLFADLDNQLSAGRGPLVVITVIETGATLGEHGRRVLAQRMREKNKGVVAWAVVIEKRGLWGTITRTIAATVRLTSRSTYPFKVFPSVDEGVLWLQQHSKAQLHTLTSEVEELRQLLASLSE